MSIDTRVQRWADISQQALTIRYQVFVIEQAVPLELELDGLDEFAWHALVLDRGTPVATGRLLIEDEVEFDGSLNPPKKIGRIGRMAVLKDARCRGLGSKLLELLLKKGIELGVDEFYLHAQLSAKSLYERYGFIAEGEIFEEAGIGHQLMRLKL